MNHSEVKPKTIAQATILFMLVFGLSSSPNLGKLFGATPVCGSTITANTILTSDLTGCAGNGIVVGADGVTLDCQGHTISGTSASGSNGILIPDRRDVTVVNCTAKSFYNGVYVDNSSFTSVLSSSAQSNHNGFYVDGGNNDTLRSDSATGLYTSTGGGWGFTLSNSFNNTMMFDSVANFQYGFYLYSVYSLPNGTVTSLPTYNTVRSNTVVGVVVYGFYVETSASTIDNNVQCQQSLHNAYGIYVISGNLNVVSRNTICNDETTGIAIFSGSTGNVVRSNILVGNNPELYIALSSNNLVYDNLFNNPVNFVQTPNTSNYWNISKTPGQNIAGGSFLGGNYWVDYLGRDTNGDSIGDTLVPYTTATSPDVKDFLPLCAHLGCPSTVKSLFEQDWSDYDNNGVVNILDVAQIAVIYGKSSPYFDLFQASRVGITDVSTLALHYGQFVGQTPFLGQGQPAGRMDPSWRQYCNLIPFAYWQYCQGI